MSDTLTCSECGETAESADDLGTSREVPEIETSNDGSISLFENRDLFLCQNCKNPLGTSRS